MAVRKLTLVLDLDSGQFSTRVVDATGKLRTLDQAVGRTSASMERGAKSGRVLGDAMRNIHHQLSFVHIVMAAVTASVGGLTLALVRANAEAQKSVVMLEGLSKSATRAGKRIEAAGDFKFIQNMSKEAPFALDVLTDAFVKFKSVGIDPTKGALQAMADGMSMFGASDDMFKRASIAIQQMMGKGVVSMEELRQQLGEAFPIAIKVMARAAGMGVRDFVKQVSLGKVEAEQLIGTNGSFWKEMEKEAQGSAERMMNTWDGQVSVIKTHLRELAYAMGGFTAEGGFAQGGFMDTLTQGAKDLNSWLADPKTVQGAKDFGAALAGLVIDIQGFIHLVAQMAPVIKIAAGSFVAFKGYQMATTAITSLAGAMGLAVGKQGVMVKASLAARIEEARFQAQVATGKAVLAGSAQDTLRKAAATEAAAVTENVAIQTTISKLAEERLAVQANIAALNQRRIAANAAFQNNMKAGFGNTVVGAGNLSGRTGSGQLTADLDKDLARERAKLTAVTKAQAAADAALAASNVRVTAATAATTAATKAMSLAAIAGRGAVTALNAVLSLLGGPVIAGVLLSVGAVVTLVNMHNKRIAEMNAAYKGAESAAKSTADVLKDASYLYQEINAVTGETAKAQDEFAAAMSTAKLKSDDLTKSLIIQAEAQRRLQMITIGTQLMKVREHQANMGRIVAREQANEERKLRGPRGEAGSGAAAAGAAAVGLPSAADMVRERAARQPTRYENILTQLNDAEKKLGQAALRVREAYTEDIVGNLGLDIPGDTPSSGGGGNKGKDKKTSQTAAQRLADEIERMKTGRPAIETLIDTMDIGAEAAEDMRAKIAEMRREGGVISPEMEAEAVRLAAQQVNLGRAYDEVKSIFGQARDATVAADEAMSELGDSTNEIDKRTQRFSRSLNQARAEALRLDPALAADTERVKKLDETIAKAVADRKLMEVAGAARALHEEMERLAGTSIDPALGAWDEYGAKVREIDALVRQATENPHEDPAKQAELLRNLANSRSRYTERTIAERKFELGEEIAANREAQMTVDGARQAAHSREIARIMALTDVSKLNDEERALHEAGMLALREEAIKAANDRMIRDMESPMEKMLREWQDTSEQMKSLSGDWLSDFMGMLRNGETGFGEFAMKVLEDYLWMLAQAKMASIIDQGIDAVTGIISGMFPGGSAASTMSGGSISKSAAAAAKGIRVPGNHMGGIVGSEATFFRNVSPAMFAGAQKYHTGGIAGLRPNEVPTILEKGEGVFTTEQMAAMGGVGNVAIEFNLINESGQPLEASEGGRSFDGEKYIIDVVVANLNRPGPMRTAVKQAK